MPHLPVVCVIRAIRAPAFRSLARIAKVKIVQNFDQSRDPTAPVKADAESNAPGAPILISFWRVVYFRGMPAVGTGRKLKESMRYF